MVCENLLKINPKSVLANQDALLEAVGPETAKQYINEARQEIISKRNRLDDQLGFDSSDLDFNELDNLRGKLEYSKSLYNEYRRYYKVHDSFYTYSNNQKSIVNYKNCSGIVYLIRNPFDTIVSHYYWRNSLNNKNAKIDPIS